ncbi:lipolytic protein G-D-S-L family [Caldicellulosiruptor kronotskyensis 2002]|uniref:Lipolytic protein G-D-S-L family n=1 Tax=Caldicellulosiruptor kronotskyensis (strain DSM 18902 / VKM B-2412 / 2002) TaxID=632348 RepID=E4SD77_CALK2|nr:rhamnogalacturonan acetylesterase [Caldicellulosiruptor kronotskyensis]ADQ45141.1 lipolytic protein G-D-S-L family [Caldicellulosiruptor kronotskyensis 2002]
MEFKFNFEPVMKSDFINVSRSSIYKSDKKYGFESFRFRVDLPNKNYDVKIVLKNLEVDVAKANVMVFPRRIMLKDLKIKYGEVLQEEFTVNVKDERIVFEIETDGAEVCSIEVKEAQNPIVIYLAGDSTVCDQENLPYAGWGQAFGCFFKKGVSISNHAYSGRSSKSFIEEGRLEQILQTIKEGDYLFIQFGHNDQKDDKRYTEANTTYKIMLKVYIDEARKRGAVPVLVTPVARRHFDENGKIAGSGLHFDYPKAMRELAEEENVFLIDLLQMSSQLYEKLGVEESKKLFVYAKPGEYPQFPEGIEDNTHFNMYGACEIARLVVEGIKKVDLKLREYLR